MSSPPLLAPFDGSAGVYGFSCFFGRRVGHVPDVRLPRAGPSRALPEQPRAGDLRQDRRRHEAAHCIHGGAAFVLPLIQDYAYLSLEPIQIEIPLRGALSMENIRVNVPSVFTVAIGTSPR